MVIEKANSHTGTPHTLVGLDSVLFEYSGDRMALQALKRVPFLEQLTSDLLDRYAMAERTRLMADAIEIDGDTLPAIYRIFKETATILGVIRCPPLFVEGDLNINAYTTGADEPIVVVSEGAVSRLTPQELSFVFGHELGHIMAGHVRYQNLAEALAMFGASAASLIPVLGQIGETAINAALVPPLQFWSRRSEFTADRAGALACQDWDSIWRFMIKIMGFPSKSDAIIDPDILFRQVRRYEERLGESFKLRFFELNKMFNQTHPRMATRALELAIWRDDGSFDELIHADEAGRDAMRHLLRQDPIAHALLSMAGTSICNWAVEEFGRPLDVCGSVIRRMVRGDKAPPMSPFDAILHMELSVCRKASDENEYTVHLLVNRRGQPIKVAVPVPWSALRADIPNEIREEMMRLNNERAVRVLYTASK